MDEQTREFRQYFEDLYITFLGSYLKNGHTQNTGEILKITDIHFKALVQRLKEIKAEEI